jgi:zinc transport system permease protein
MSFEILTYGFMHRALISGIAIAILCSVVGLFLVLRRYSLFGDAIAHSSFGGIALGLLAGVYPLWTAYGVSIVSALIITKIKDKYNISGDASIAVLLSSGIAAGLVIIGFSGGFTIDIFSFLFGSNEEQAKVSGIAVEKINYLIVFMAGITVVTSIQLVGVLLISALFVIPNVTAIMYGRGFKQTAIISMSFSIFSVVAGILISYIFDITPAGTIVLLSICLLAGTMVIKSAGLLSKN